MFSFPNDILITCVHHGTECSKDNDPGSLETATHLWKTFKGAGKVCTLLAKSVDDGCDVNHEACNEEFEYAFRRLMPVHDVLIDVHSFPKNEVFLGAESFVCVFPKGDDRPMVRWLKNNLHTLFPGANVADERGHNRLIHAARDAGKLAFILHVPYERVDSCEFRLPLTPVQDVKPIVPVRRTESEIEREVVEHWQAVVERNKIKTREKQGMMIIWMSLLAATCFRLLRN